MRKLAYKDKREIVRLYVQEHYRYRTIANIFKVLSNGIERIANQFLKHGKDPLI